MPNFNCRVTGVLLNDSDEVLIIKRNKNYLNSDRSDNEFYGWEFCGGGIEHNESPEDAIIREYQEEVGLEISVIDIFNARTGIRSGSPLLNISYICKYISGEVRLTNEHLEYKWVKLADLASYDMGCHVNKDRDRFFKNYPDKIYD